MKNKFSVPFTIGDNFRSFYILNKFFFYLLFQNLLLFLSPVFACLLMNFKQKILSKNSLFFYESEKKLFKVIDKNFTVYFNDKMRGINTYAYGISHRANLLASTYSLSLIKFQNNDVIIDCGANFGDIYFWTLLKKLSIQYISFEPSPEEFKCIELNCKNQKNNNVALSNVDGSLDFYIKSDTGDSSLIIPSEGYHKKIRVKTITLDNYITINKIHKIKFLKLEAEGAEPEILEGSKKIINRIEYIGVDGSPERGVKKETTIEFASNFLFKNGFEMISIKFGDSFVKALFKNINFNC